MNSTIWWRVRRPYTAILHMAKILEEGQWVALLFGGLGDWEGSYEFAEVLHTGRS